MTARAFCATINNYTDQDMEAVACPPEAVRYMIYGRETGESGTPHLQMYIELRKPQRASWVSKWLTRAHIEPRKGPRDAARTYCMKEGQYTEHGDWAAGGQGTRNDLRKVVDMIKSGTPTIDVMLSEPEIYSRNIKFCEKLERMVEKDATQAWRKVDVEVLYGPPGCGKSRYAHDTYPGIFTVNVEDSFPFDGYNGEQAILLDDFDGHMKHHQLLKVLDGHQYRCNVKGGHRYAQWTKVVITSNYKPEDWYKRGLSGALKRRLNNICEMGEGAQRIFNDVTNCETKWRGNSRPATDPRVDLRTSGDKGEGVDVDNVSLGEVLYYVSDI